jgi:hypothetical protein
VCMGQAWRQRTASTSAADGNGAVDAAVPADREDDAGSNKIESAKEKK